MNLKTRCDVCKGDHPYVTDLNEKLTIVANPFVNGSDRIVATPIDIINFVKRNTSFMISWYPK